MFKISKGFTIIELLVVITIIAIVASIVIVNVSLYVQKAKDSSIKANMDSMITDAALFFQSNGTYINLCTDTASGFANAYAEATRNASSAGSANALCYTSATQWASFVLLNNSGGIISGNPVQYFWCVDYMGNKKEEAIVAQGATSCQ